MSTHDDTMPLPDLWGGALGKLTQAASLLEQNVASITKSVEYRMDTGLLTAPPNVISDLTNSLSLESMNIESFKSHVEHFADITSHATSCLLDIQKTAYLSSDLVSGSTLSILESAASMATKISSIDVSSVVTDIAEMHLSTSNIPNVLSIPSQNALLDLGHQLQSNVSSFNNLLETSCATAQLNTEIFSSSIEAMDPYLAYANQEIATLTKLSTSLYDNMLTQPITPSNFLFKAPTIEPYAALRATSVFVGANDDALNRSHLEPADTCLDTLGEELESRLQRIHPDLAKVYLEGIEAIKAGRPGWMRHAGVSFRTTFDHLLRQLAPDAALKSFFKNQEQNKINGEYSRNARLKYIFRKVAVGSYEKMAEQDIKLAEATFFPTNKTIHTLSSPLSELQMRVLYRRIQGSLSVVLEAVNF